eukprot:GILJ01001751.1.p1 GENE.GILJ01001751.1~~GILJ01001751.1.p1  ORF type:complete len:475 (+),score=71.71 GILJ01001751.1:73-1425(+)
MVEQEEKEQEGRAEKKSKSKRGERSAKTTTATKAPSATVQTNNVITIEDDNDQEHVGVPKNENENENVEPPFQPLKVDKPKTSRRRQQEPVHHSTTATATANNDDGTVWLPFRRDRHLVTVVEALMAYHKTSRLLNNKWFLETTKKRGWDLTINDQRFLHLAVACNCIQNAVWLLERGVNIARQYPNGELMTLAIENDNRDMAILLWQHGEQIREEHLLATWARINDCRTHCEDNETRVVVVHQMLRWLYQHAKDVTVTDVSVFTRIVEGRAAAIETHEHQPFVFLLWMLIPEKFGLTPEQRKFIVKFIVTECPSFEIFRRMINQFYGTKGTDVTTLVQWLIDIPSQSCCIGDDESRWLVRGMKTQTVEERVKECLIATKFQLLLDNSRTSDIHKRGCAMIVQASSKRCKIVQEFLTLQCAKTHLKEATKERKPTSKHDPMFHEETFSQI